eukprot:TRINITY_DN68845_c0_g1_i1.p1 TRINITY_DN68845_c0_g1~~TRINITY_DN68845_c0_g1_i1.p1  ORF type:complete len:342 (-),score=55.25 TRINITY_DN68845_c0_g1_i1:121-1083(-)
MADAPVEKQSATTSTTQGVTVPSGLSAFNHINDWYEENKACFSPPVCNLLMHKGQLSIMFVGGPNTRKDFHLEEGAEFFFQLRGDMELPTVQNGQRKLVRIKEGQVFCLPPRIPHSPQRPMPGSLGLVIERRREEGEMDGLIYYTDFENCDKVRWEHFFQCEDLRKDLPVAIQAYRDFEASKEAEHPQDWPEEARPFRQDITTEVPPPFFMDEFVLANKVLLDAGGTVPLFGSDHPDPEFQVDVVGGPSEQSHNDLPYETWLYQLRGAACVTVDGGNLDLSEGCCCTVGAGVKFSVTRPPTSVGLVLRQTKRQATLSVES